MGYKFGRRSKQALSNVDQQLVKLCEEVIQHIDFSVIEGHRSLERQKELFDEGNSNIDGVTEKGNHNYTPSRAVDVVPYKRGTNPFDGTERAELEYYRLNREFQRASRKLGLAVTWGGTWNDPLDYPHYELA